MTAPVWAALILLGLGGGAVVLTRLPPRKALAAIVLAAAGGLALMRQFPLAAPLAMVGLGLWRSAQATPTPGGSSQVESPSLRMTLDHETGEMDGEVTAGALRGAWLSELTPEQVQALVAEFETAGDEDSLALLLAWLDRRGTPHEAAPPPESGTMTEAEAYRVLGLAPGASVEEVRSAYRRLMKRVHPDLGGSSALAEMLNAAKELLDPG